MLRHLARFCCAALLSLGLAAPALARVALTGTPSTTLTVSGAVEKRLVLDAAALAAFPPAQIVEDSLPRSTGIEQMLALDDDEGRIALISTGDTRTGARHVKWLQAVEVRKIEP